MKISIIHATRRGWESFRAINMWLMDASHTTPIEYILSVDSDDMYNYDFSDVLDFKEFKVIRNKNRSAVDAFNKGAEAATGDLFVCISDDFGCQVDWDIKLLHHIKDKRDFCAKTLDDIQPTLITLPIMDRTYYERFNYIYHPDYKHMFSDQEMTSVAIMTGKYLKFNILFPHNHYSTGKTPKDSINKKNDATWHQGETLFNERLKTNFGIENPVIPYSEIKWR